ncbi:unnamed protein product [Rotaria sordida]|uniref:N-acetylgalactosaminide beta-1,3-galactosyltransferase n=1 Tax=Rotaria sordida TaxID=392033 RepID=A0A818VQK9_9BILA|nr:unnamed protein product [Rotaria sordida]CAF3714476.1 unnamed protein product [Rotaria sordida]
MNNTIRQYVIEEIYFALTTNTQRILKTIHYLKFWAKLSSIKCLIVFEQKDFLTTANITEYLVNEGISCKVQTSNVTRYEERYLELFHMAWNNQEIKEDIHTGIKKVEWFAVGDDDTIWFVNNLLHTLQQYNSSNFMYIGDISNKKSQVIRHGAYYAYGGGGILLSRPLAVLFAQHIQECKQFLNLYGGDEMIGKCITEILQVNLTRNNNFHQMDSNGDMTGYLESGINGLVSLHHMFSMWKPFPNEHTNKINETINLIQLAYTTFDENFLKRFARVNYKTNQTLLLTMGYSFSLFNRILSRTDLTQVENTWFGTEMATRTIRPKENNKTTWYFRSLTIENFDGTIGYGIVYENKKEMCDFFPNIQLTIMN